MREIKPVPWIPHAATDFLDTIVHEDWKVFEWGSGGSTLYWGLHCRSVVSIEDDPEWQGEVTRLLEEYGLTNVDLRLIPGESGEISVHPDPHHHLNYGHVRWDGKDHPFNYVTYAKVIEEWGENTFDLVFVDAMARPSCFFHGVSRIKPGGWLLWDNSSYVPNILHVRHLFDHWERQDFQGSGPYLVVKWMATIWRKPL